MKKTIALLLAAVLILSAAGCKSRTVRIHDAPTTTGPFQVTDTFTHKKDLDVEFTHRHVGYTFGDAVWDDFNENNNTYVRGYYCVLYGDDTKAVGMIEYWIMSSESEAEKWARLQGDLYTTAEVQGNVAIFTNDRAAIESSIREMQSYDIHVEDTCDSFWELLVEMNSLVAMEE